MSLGRLWAGKAFGTSTGNLFVKLEGGDTALAGTLHFNESGAGLVVYAIKGAFDGSRLTFSGEPQVHAEGMTYGALKAAASLGPRGNLEGEWETDIGSRGTFVLFPHDVLTPPSGPEDQVPDQLHTARHHFGAIEIDRDQIITIAEEVQREFPKGRVVITVAAGSEQSRFLEDFKKLTFNQDRAEAIKIAVQEPEGGGLNKVVAVEFGPQYNLAMTQSASEAWVLGKLETLKRDFRKFERNYTTNFKRWGVGVNQLLFVGAIVFLPSLATLRDRAILMGGVLALMFAVNWLHNRYLPFAAIYLSKKPISRFVRVMPTVLSWIIAVTASAAATLLAAYLQGWLELPPTLSP
jgi:hypothetical protein